MKYEKSQVTIVLFDETVEFMAGSPGPCNPVVGDLVCTKGFSCDQVSATGGPHQFTCTGFDSDKYDAEKIGGSGKYRCDPVTCTSYNT